MEGFCVPKAVYFQLQNFCIKKKNSKAMVSLQTKQEGDI